jgi:DNA-binding response OmpR family regulator
MQEIATERIDDPRSDNILRLGNITLNLDSYRVTVGAEEVDLTLHELDLLRILCTNPGRIISYSTLCMQLWGRSGHTATRHLNVLVHRLRSKITASDPYVIDTVRGRGYGLLPARTSPTTSIKALHPDTRAGPEGGESVPADGD